MRRLNTITQKPFNRGDQIEDKVFWKYRTDRKDKSGFFVERWMSVEAFEKAKLKIKISNKQLKDKRKESLVGCIRLKFLNIKSRAKENNIPFDLDIDYLVEIAPELCPVFKQPLVWDAKGDSKYIASLDKIIPEKGYIKGNVQWVSYLANTMKNCATQQELKEFANWILNDEKNKPNNQPTV